ncbi:MAG: energy transducer TonB [Sedimentisphaerales bacterium]|nr:energy transducer TonB [Sedimentisphaerales bacterium]
MIFCLLAAAKTTPPLNYTVKSEPMRIISLEKPSPASPEQADQKIITDIVLLNAKSSDMELPEPAPESFASEFSRLAERVEDVTFELPGLPVFSSSMSLQIPAEDIPAGITVRVLSASQADISPIKTAGAVPQYPQWARRNKLEGTVILRFIVTEKGNIENINISEIDGDERFGTEALQAVSQWRFSPAIKAGKPVSCWCFQKINFRFSR